MIKKSKDMRCLLNKRMMSSVGKNPFEKLKKTLKGSNKEYFSLKGLENQSLIEQLPYSVRVLLECNLRNCDNFSVKEQDVEKIIQWKKNMSSEVEIPFKPARVILQDFTGVPCVVDLAAMRDAMKRMGGDPNKINPLCPVDLVIDHSIQADFSRTNTSADQNEEIEFARNRERFQFLKWGQKAFDNFRIIPPGAGIVHQVNLEYLARVVFDSNNLVYPDSVVGTDSHTTMINGLGVLGWGVGGIEAEAVMMGQNISMVLPEVIGFKMTGSLSPLATATDLVLTCTQMLRKRGVVGKFVEFYGDGVKSLTLADRATISNMAPEYGATMGYFPVDSQTIDYLRLTARSTEQLDLIQNYLKVQGLFNNYDGQENLIKYTGESLTLDLSTVEPCVSGPKRPHDRVLVSQLKNDFNICMNAPNGFKGFGIKESDKQNQQSIIYNNKPYTIKHGSVVIAAITSCTNTSNHNVLLQAGILAKNANLRGLKVNEYIKTTLSPGSKVVPEYLEKAGLMKHLEALGFYQAGFGCMTCIGNTGDLDKEVHEAVVKGDLAVCAVLSGNRNFEARVHQLTKGNYLASPPLVVAYALAGTVDIDFEKTPIGVDKNGKNVFLKEIWPSKEEVNELVKQVIQPKMFKDNYDKIAKGTDRWNQLPVSEDSIYKWDDSTYIQNPPFFQDVQAELKEIKDIQGAYCLASFGDFITTDHISPAGAISKNSPAGRYLNEKGIQQKDYNSYGSRRGNDLIMARGTFANTRIINKMNNKVGPQTLHIPTNTYMDFYDAAMLYKSNQQATIILAGQEYGSGSSRDWAAKGPYLQGVKAVIAQTFERIHRSNLVGMGILPLEFKKGENADTLNLTGKEQFNIKLNQGNLKVNQDIHITTNCGKSFTVRSRLDTDPEVEYFKNGGILQYVLRKLAKQ